jgi:hypothetical protein
MINNSSAPFSFAADETPHGVFPPIVDRPRGVQDDSLNSPLLNAK